MFDKYVHTKREMDINDVFDNLLMCEDTSYQKGYKDGVEKGKSDGNLEGFHLGYHRGAEYGAELGFMYSVIKSLIGLKDQNMLQCSEKACHSLQETVKLIKEFPQTNVDNIDLEASLRCIRSSYKKSLSYLKIKCDYPDKDLINF
ncbi:oral cancer-overexpressed protein 1-like [Ctenocephalides felis]|uniref:oral cancer-overexpressed protein 1-like n=1 Tax=Ctenocephalides felis TaxID=7515 RepID=UPI000E6E1922|nr:oral cancer-overexpressed protein 1-like [Ctenocephalides felis]